MPFRSRPIKPTGYDTCATWPCWLVDDQREASGRTDVLSYETAVLTEPVKISGQPMVQSRVVDDRQRRRLGRQAHRRLPRRGRRRRRRWADISWRSRWTSFAGDTARVSTTPKPIASNTPLEYGFALPTSNHVFLPGHRIMVQIQSSWFPLYDRNPQTFVPNIFWAKASDYKKAEHRIFHEPGHVSFIELPIVSGPR